MSILDFLATNMNGQLLYQLVIPVLQSNEKFATQKVA